jgi:hypothetical protein
MQGSTPNAATLLGLAVASAHCDESAREALVAMVQAANLRDSDDVAHRGWLRRTPGRSQCQA